MTMENIKFSATKSVLILVTLGLIGFTYQGIIWGEQFMAIVWLVFWNYFTRNWGSNIEWKIK